ncbi:cobalamin-independent methionine synthase II family protein [Occallatibacter riparius]|uniref:Cobalamin-independent methionine synthase II family protein n=1 Tax=Occallatibacter riparius TaxID=1002689 RepID=A0A9J7BX92_9BACT|nr:cobalamin-independent methionine synthase II family protein [Occallatibacter riparius]UWZ85566.1 cobalamin-independent methionine synthase II family protein [Occallatibacter riparius]
MSSVYRADHVGSFLRPTELLETRKAGAGNVREIEDRHILRVLNRQKEIGLDAFTDGEFRRTNFMSDFTDAVEGFDFGDAVQRKWNEEKKEGAGAAVSSINGIVTSALKQRQPLTGREVPFMREHAPGPIKITLPSATQFPAISFKYGITDKVYRDPYAMLEAVTAIMAEDIRGLATSGISYLQIDAPRYSYYLDPKWTAWMEKELRVDPAEMLAASLKADNACFAAARHPDVTLAIHLCRGNNRSHWYAEGGYDAIAERFFHELAVDRFLLEYDDERSGNFEPLRLMPQGKTVVLGLVSSKRPELERKGDLLRRIDEAAKHLPLEQLAVSPQCGFASTMEGNLLTEDQQWAKLQLVADVAREVWG